ncbi:MAG: sigma-70 family RNA polymerase sigma factor [Actinobacteria bacterium]|nr:sigma-70 family RNA polymerase sigma factor [Actinomycetota bacterium]
MNQETPEALDRVAAEEALRGDASAFAALVERHQSAVFACAFGITGNREDAADATQETFLRLFRHLDQFDPERPLRPYLMTIALNCARSVRRKTHPESGGEEGELIINLTASDSPGPGHALLAQERRHSVRQVIDALPAMLREVCVLFYLNGCSCRETAGILRTSEGAVRVALHRARERLQGSSLREWI